MGFRQAIASPQLLATIVIDRTRRSFISAFASYLVATSEHTHIRKATAQKDKGTDTEGFLFPKKFNRHSAGLT